MEDLTKDKFILDCGIYLSRIVQRINKFIESAAIQTLFLFVAAALHKTEGKRSINEYNMNITGL